MARYPSQLQQLIQLLKKLPGVGNKTAERYGFHLVDWSAGDLSALAQLLTTVQSALSPCPLCGCYMQELVCPFCEAKERDHASICVVASPKEVYLIEETRSYAGLYHVIGQLLCPLEGKAPAASKIDLLRRRISEYDVQEVLLAFDSTVEGDATALMLRNKLSDLPVKVTRLAFGMPMGSALDHLDGYTLSRALTGRHHF